MRVPNNVTASAFIPSNPIGTIEPSNAEAHSITMGRVYTCAFSRSGKYLVTANQGEQIRLINTPTSGRANG